MSSEKFIMSEFEADREVYLLFGKNGWIGGKLIELLTAQGKTFFLAESRTYNREAVWAEVDRYNPTHILNASGVTGRPNVDWCEDHRLETIRSNVIGTLIVADICESVSSSYVFQ
jgi:3,5-epimerase/4-reductase